MKKLGLGLSLLAAILISQSAAADSRHGGFGFNDHRFGNNHYRRVDRGFGRYSNRHFNRFRGNAYHYGRVGGRRGADFVSISYGNRFLDRGFYNRGFYDRRFYNRGVRFNRFGHRNRIDTGDFVGGLVLGSLLSNPVHTSTTYETVRYRSAPVVRNREVVYVNADRRSATTRARVPARRLLRDLQGNCFEIAESANGDEIRSEIDPSFCDY